MARLSNKVLGILNLITFLLSIPILTAGVWLSHRPTSDCASYLAPAVISIGAFLLIVSLAGVVGAFCGSTCLLWIYLVAMLVLIVLLFGFTIFAFVVTNKGAGEVVSGRGYKEYRLGEYGDWLRRKVGKDWGKIGACVREGRACGLLEKKVEGDSAVEFFQENLEPLQSGCCKPPASCNLEYVNATFWFGTPGASDDPDCQAWSNDPSTLCYNCDSCKAGFIASLKDDWKKVAIINIIFLIFLIAVYSIGCQAFRNNRADNRYNWKGHP